MADTKISALTDGSVAELTDVIPAARGAGNVKLTLAQVQSLVTGDVTAAQISDASAAGRAVLTAADAAAQRTALGLGTAATTAAKTYSKSSGIALPSSTDGATSFAHGLGGIPSMYGAALRCISASQGYAVGDEVGLMWLRSTSLFCGISASPTLITLNWKGAFPSTQLVLDSIGGGGSVPGGANWELVLWGFR